MSNMCTTISTIVLVLISSYVFNVFGTKPEHEEEYVRTSNGDIAFPDDLNIGLARQSDQPHYHNHHHHNHPYHHFHHNHQSEVDEQGETRTVFDDGATNSDTNGSMQIPLDLVQKFNQYNLSDLLVNYVEDESIPIIGDRFGDADGARDGGVMPKLAECQPELQTIKLAPTDDFSTLYYPSCTRVERCGGCCSYASLSCQPTNTETLSFKLLKLKYKGGNKLVMAGKEVIQVEKHTKCKCDCTIKPENCSINQQYEKSSCTCVCKNKDEEQKCLKSNKTKLWNSDGCFCQCRDITQCSTGSEFDHNQCRCKPIFMRKRYVDYTKNYKPESPPVVPLDDEK